MKKQRASERIPSISSPTISGHFAVWVTVWSGKFAARKTEQIKEKTGENLTIFTGLVELVAGLEPATC